MKKKAAICAVLVIFALAAIWLVSSGKGDVSHVQRVIGDSALYDEATVQEACRVVEKTFAKEFEGCTLTELRYDAEVENRFAREIAEYEAENRELIVLLSTFQTDKKGGDGSFSPNHTYANWQWWLARSGDSENWEIIGSGY